MRATVTDLNVLSQLSPRSIRSYLRVHGWQRQGDGHELPDIWVSASDSVEYEVIAPSSLAARDFTARAAELLRTVSIAEDRSEIDIVRDITTMAFDVQYIHTHHGGPTGTTPLREASAAFAAAQLMLSASTATIEEPGLVLPSRRSQSTTSFMNQVLAGPTLEGSYVLSVWVPIPPRLSPDEDSVLFSVDNEPFERRATIHLNQALLAVKDAAADALNTDEGLDAFIRREALGLSANLCEAVTSLAGEDAGQVDVRFAWALDRPAPNVVPQITFQPDEVPVLKEAARELRERIAEEPVRLRGNVVRLHREGQLGSGEVTVAAVILDDPSEKLRKVAVDLAESDYNEAIEAHGEYLDVDLTGSLVRRGTRTYLRDVTQFAVRRGSIDSQ